jgi:molybdate transport system regulatory protein
LLNSYHLNIINEHCVFGSSFGNNLINCYQREEIIIKISGRNKIPGKVTKITPGVVSAEVEIEAGKGIKIVGLITKGSLDELNINEGDELTALIKATSVMFIKE